MTDKHTPGPWAAERSCPQEGHDCWWIRANGSLIAATDGFHSLDTRHANAALIARAPELLAENDALWSNLVSLLLHETGVEADDFPMSVDCAFETLKNEFNQRASDRDRLRERIAELEAERMWQTISELPKNTPVILFDSTTWAVASAVEVNEGHRIVVNPENMKATHFMPLPKMEGK